MITLLQLALSNAVAATVLALLAGSASLLLKRPPLTRALWVLVLLKLLTPPLWHVNVPRPNHPAETRPQMTVVDSQVNATEIPITTEVPELEGVTIEPAPVRDAAPISTAPAIQRPHVRWWRAVLGYWPAAVLGVWVLGIVVHLVSATASVARMRRLTRRAAPVDSVTLARARELARRLGLGRCPSVLYVDGPMSPMLCAIGTSPRLLLPAELWFRLDAGQRDTVLTHELAHLKRGDHWVRALEVLVACVYWWHPVVWWARRAIREATEQCCDAWVLWALPRSAASYATALIEAIDFISTARPAMPALASGMGQFTDLKRRLVMIKRGTAGKALTWPALGAVCALGGLVLPLAPSFGQVAGNSAPVSAGPAAETTPTGTVSVAPAGAIIGEVATTVETTPATPEVTGSVSVQTSSSSEDPRAVSEARREVDRLRAQLARAEQRLARLEGRNNRNSNGIETTGEGTTAANQYRRALAGVSAPRTAEEGAAMNRLGVAASGNQQQRLDALENQVREILNELRQMKREQRNSSRTSGEQAK